MQRFGLYSRMTSENNDASYLKMVFEQYIDQTMSDGEIKDIVESDAMEEAMSRAGRWIKTPVIDSGSAFINSLSRRFYSDETGSYIVLNVAVVDFARIDEVEAITDLFYEIFDDEYCYPYKVSLCSDKRNIFVGKYIE